MRGSAERLTPILMTALATGLALVPLVVGGNKPGQEIEYPMAAVILGGLCTSTLLNLFLLPPIYAAWGASGNGSTRAARWPARANRPASIGRQARPSPRTAVRGLDSPHLRRR